MTGFMIMDRVFSEYGAAVKYLNKLDVVKKTELRDIFNKLKTSSDNQSSEVATCTIFNTRTTAAFKF